MSFTTRYGPAIHIGGASLSETGTLVDEISDPSEEGWDQLTQHWYFQKPFFEPGDLAALFPQGAPLGMDRKFWLTHAKPSRRAAGLWLVEAHYKGWDSPKPFKVRIGSAAEQQTAENVDIFGVGTFDKVQVHQNTPTISITRLVEDIDVDNMHPLVGTQLDPPTDPVSGLLTEIEPPANFWTYLSQFTYHYPNQWVLMGTDQDLLPGTRAALVTDNYKFIQDITPG